MAKSRGYAFTLNNPTGEEVWEGKWSYIIRGTEVGECGTPHIQGYVYYKSPVAFASVRKQLPARCAHIDAAKGSPQQNIEYCSKDGSFIEQGEPPKQGKRNDIKAVKAIIADGGGMSDVIEAVDSYQAMRCAELILKYVEPKRDWKPEVFWFHGETGTGKTRKASELAPNAWFSARNLKWWEGYDAHEDVIIDDFRGDFCTFHELLRILDRYEYRIEVKGGSRQLLCKRIFITSCYAPDRVYENREDIQQLIRRIDTIEFFGTEVLEQKSGGNSEPPTWEDEWMLAV